MGCRVSAFSRDVSEKNVEALKALGAKFVKSSSNVETITEEQLHYDVVITCVPHTNEKMDKLW